MLLIIGSFYGICISDNLCMVNIVGLFYNDFIDLCLVCGNFGMLVVSLCWLIWDGSVLLVV